MEDQRSRPDTMEAPLVRLRELGLICPPSCTLQRFLMLLADAGLVDAATATAYARQRQEQAFARAATVDSHALESAVLLLDEIDDHADDSELLKRLADALAPPPPPVEPVAAPPVDQAQLAAPDSSDPPEVQPPAAPPAVMARLRHLARRPVAVAALALWSVAMVVVGAWQRDAIASAVTAFRIRVLRQSWLVSAELRLERLRRQAAALPGVTAVWTDYATAAEAQHEYADACFAYRHLLARSPDSPELLNRLAWMLCTAEDPAARDPMQALELAERAYALDPRPHITDTLAEAAFQTGDVHRAVALEEQALAAAGPEDGFYRRQLEKFRAGMESLE